MIIYKSKDIMVTKNTNETNKLIDNLTSDLSNVRPLAPPYKRTLLWGILSFSVIVLIAALQNGFRYDIPIKIQTTDFLLENVALLLIGTGALFSTFRLSIPDIKRDNISLILLAGGSAIWVSIILLTVMDTKAGDIQNAVPSHGLPHCISDLLMLTTLPMAILFILVKKSATVFPILAGYSLVLAIASIGALVMRYVCPVDNAAHLFLTHFTPAFALSILGLLIGNLFLRW